MKEDKIFTFEEMFDRPYNAEMMKAMQENENLRIRRIEQMEQLFDKVTAGCEDAAEKLQVLAEYYDSGLWLSDYEADEKGLLPKDLKRGVLSEDGLYNLLSTIK